MFKSEIVKQVYSSTQTAIQQHIGAWARQQKLVALPHKGRWYFIDYHNRMCSAEWDLTADETQAFLKGDDQ
jgi:hypothetical protein